MTTVLSISEDVTENIPKDAVQVDARSVPLELRAAWSELERFTMRAHPPTHLDIIRLYYVTARPKPMYFYYCGFNTNINGESAFVDFVATAFRKRE